MNATAQKSKWDAWWIDVPLALALFASSLIIVMAAGHGIGVLGMLFVEEPLLLLGFWGGYTYTSLLLLAGAACPRSSKQWFRMASIVAGFAYSLFLLSCSDTVEITAISMIPVAVMLLIIIWVSCGSETASRRRRTRS